jgi:small redox-active disulfide protein 2
MSTKIVKVFGPGCKRCQTTAEMIQTEADKLGIEITIEKVTDYAELATCGVTATPGVMVDGKLVHAGGLPVVENIAGWLQK